MIFGPVFDEAIWWDDAIFLHTVDDARRQTSAVDAGVAFGMERVADKESIAVRGLAGDRSLRGGGGGGGGGG